MTESPPSLDDQAAQRVLLVTGLSGAGKSTALDVLEDIGWETIDNFPVRLLNRLISKPDNQRGLLAIGFDSRTRGLVPHEMIELVKSLGERDDIAVSTLYIDCAGGEIERRYNETRRRHPMAEDRPVQEGIKAERELLEPLRRRADMVEYDRTAEKLVQLFVENFDQFESHVDQGVRDAAPRAAVPA